MEQITYPLFLKRLDELQTLEDSKAARLGTAPERSVFPDGVDSRGRSYADLRWSRFKNAAPAEMFTIVGEHAFPFLRTLGGDGSTCATHVRDARFTIPTPGLLQKVVDLLDLVERFSTAEAWANLDDAALAQLADEVAGLPNQMPAEHLVENGVVPASRFYESPFTDLSPTGPEGLFTSDEVDQMVAVLDEVRRNATAA